MAGGNFQETQTARPFDSPEEPLARAPEYPEGIATGTVADPEAEIEDPDDIIITDEVIAVVAGAAATEVETVAGMSTGLAGDIVEALGRRNPTKGVKVEIRENRAIIDLFVIVKYGHKISDIAWEIQEKVKDTVEMMTGVTVDAVNIHVQGIDFSSYEK